jgi:hypothetical protein
MNKIKVDGQILVVPNGYDFMGFDNGIPEFSSGSVQVSKKEVKELPVKKSKNTRFISYTSDLWDDLRHGGVAQQVREKFKKVGNEAIVKANHAHSIRSAFYNEGYSIKLQKIPSKTNEFLVKRMPKA